MDNEVFTVIKIAAEKDGNLIAATTEKAFRTQQNAMMYLKTVPTVWDEVIGGVECSCERAIHQVILE